MSNCGDWHVRDCKLKKVGFNLPFLLQGDSVIWLVILRHDLSPPRRYGQIVVTILLTPVF